MSRNPLFDRVIDEIVTLHDSKNEDYGADTDPFKNFRGSEDWGVPAWLGATIRMEDKTRRIQEFIKKGRLNNESVRDSILDHAVYSIIRVALYDEASKATQVRAIQEAEANDPMLRRVERIR